MTARGERDRATGGWPDDVGLAAALGDAVVVTDPNGAIVWVNHTCSRLLGTDSAALVGTNGFDLIHPDEVARAADGVAYSMRFPGRTSVVHYRVGRGDGRWLDVEMKSAVVVRDGVDHLVLVLRDGTARQAINRALRSVASGEPLEDTSRAVVQAVTSRWPRTGAAVSVRDLDGHRRVTAEGLDPVLIAHAAGRAAAPAPWTLVPGPGQVAFVHRDELDLPVREAAEAMGFELYAAANVHDPDGRRGSEPGCLVVWFDHATIARLEFIHGADEMIELLGLALERRHRLWQLWHAARHDHLTGLLNRAGLLERLRPEVMEVRRSGAERAGLLYVDLDGLKTVNDQRGHAAGDAVLVAAGERLRAAVGPDDVIARLGGDEFVVVTRLPAADAGCRAEALAARVIETLAAAPEDDRAGPDGPAPVLAASVGIALDDLESPPEQMVERADGAMYRAKVSGRSRWSH